MKGCLGPAFVPAYGKPLAAMCSGWIRCVDRLPRSPVSFASRFVAGSECGRWRSVRGIDWISGDTTVAEVVSLHRFKDARHLPSYRRLVPRAHDSGDEDDEPLEDRHVGQAGRFKWRFIEAEHGAERKSDRFRSIFDRRPNGGNRDHNRGYIAVGHELSRVGVSCLKHERHYGEPPSEQPGRIE